MTQAFGFVGKDHHHAPLEAGTPASTTNATRKPMIRVPRRWRSVRSSKAQVRDAATTSPRAAEPKATVKEMVVWFSKDHEALKLPQLVKVSSTELEGNTNENRDKNSFELEPHPHNIKHHSGKLAETIQAQAEETTTDGEKASQNLLAIKHLQLQNLEDHNFEYLATCKRELEVEVKRCGEDGVGQQPTNSKGITERARLTMKHEADADMNQTVEYHQYILDMQRKFEEMSSHLRKTRTDMACVKHIVSNCARVRCRCCWCRAYTAMQKAYSRLRSILAMAHVSEQVTSNALDPVRPKERNRVGLTRRSFSFKLCCVYVSSGPNGS